MLFSRIWLQDLQCPDCSWGTESRYCTRCSRKSWWRQHWSWWSRTYVRLCNWWDRRVYASDCCAGSPTQCQNCTTSSFRGIDMGAPWYQDTGLGFLLWNYAGVHSFGDKDLNAVCLKRECVLTSQSNISFASGDCGVQVCEGCSHSTSCTHSRCLCTAWWECHIGDTSWGYHAKSCQSCYSIKVSGWENCLSHPAFGQVHHRRSSGRYWILNIFFVKDICKHPWLKYCT